MTSRISLAKEIAELCMVPHGTMPTVLRDAVPNPEVFLGEDGAVYDRMLADRVLRRRVGVFEERVFVNPDEYPKVYEADSLKDRRDDDVSTLVPRGLQRIEGPARDFCLQLKAQDPDNRWATVHSVLTDSPPNAQGLGVHWDLNAVPALQVRGSKTWYVFDPVVGADELVDPWIRRGFTDEERARLTPELAAYKVTLYPGDIIVVGAGLPHFCVGGSEGSLHVSFGPLPHHVYEAYGNEDHLL